MNSIGHILPSDQVSTSVSVISLLRVGSLLHHAGSVEMDMWFSSAGCVVKYNPILWPQPLSPYCIGKKRKVICKDQNLGNAAKKNPQSWAKTIDKMGWRCLETPEQEGLELWSNRWDGEHGWINRQAGQKLLLPP